MFSKITVFAVTSMLLAGCAGRGDYQTYYHAEQGDYDAALSAAKATQSSRINGLLFGSVASQCLDYSAVVTVQVARGDFAGATDACRAYDDQCAVVPNSNLCFYYSLSELSAAGSDQDLAGKLRDEAKEMLHFRWLMLRDDYEGRQLKRPIY
ncbi:MAG: hypothetical protein NWP69_07200 [Congregibacter sp.]|nr:hypothetical protein [Congregibacter sp.]MDP5071679.1 hypothetical protein [Congregibacter sp.]